MKKIIYIALVMLLVVGAVSRGVNAAPTDVETVFVYQGSIKVDGSPFVGTGYFKVAIVNEIGDTLWSNDGTSVGGSEPEGEIEVEVNQGIFYIRLGDTSVIGMSAIDESIFTTGDILYLKSWFDDGQHGFSEFSPSIRIVSSAYSMNTQFFRGYSPDDFFFSSGQIASDQIADKAVTADKISAFTDNNSTFYVGRGVDENVSILADVQGTSKPGLRFNDTSNTWQFSNNGTAWSDLGTGGSPSGPAGGDLSGTYPNPDIAPGAIVDADINAAAAISWSKINPAITGATIDSSVVGGTTPAAGTFLNLQTGVDGADGQLTIFSEQGGTDYSVVFQPNAAMTQDTTYTMPPDDGTASGQVLTTDGSGNLSWAAAGGGGTTGTYGELYVANASTSQSVTSAGWVQLTAFTTAGLSNNTTPNPTNDDITVSETGIYLVLLSLSFSGSVNDEFDVRLRRNGVINTLDNLAFMRKLGVAGDIGSTSISGLASLTAGDTIEVWATSDAAAGSMVISDANLTVVRLQ